MHLTFADTIDTLGRSILGLTLGCCRCHDHKYDPLSSRDYYGLYGILESTRFAFPGCEPNQQPRDLVPLPLSAEAAERSRRIDAELAAIDLELKRLDAEQSSTANTLRKTHGGLVGVLSEGRIEDGRSAELDAPPAMNPSSVVPSNG